MAIITATPRISADGTIPAWRCPDGHVAFTEGLACCWIRTAGRGIVQYADSPIVLEVKE